MKESVAIKGWAGKSLLSRGWHPRTDHLVALTGQRAIGFRQVMSASVKPRLAGRQPSNRGGVPRVMTRLSSHHRLRGKRGSAVTGPPIRQGNLMRTYLGWLIVRRSC